MRVGGAWPLAAGALATLAALLVAARPAAAQPAERTPTAPAEPVPAESAPIDWARDNAVRWDIVDARATAEAPREDGRVGNPRVLVVRTRRQAAPSAPRSTGPVTDAATEGTDAADGLPPVAFLPAVRGALEPAAAAPGTAGAAGDLPGVAEAQIARWVRHYTGPGRGDVVDAVRRAGPWMTMITDRLARAGLPAGLAYLPVIESSYVPHARSRSGAVGLWQLMPETARMLGLTIDPWVDERRDPDRATDAALRHLTTLHRLLGDWPLALAAYNAGDGRLSRALDATAARTRGGAHVYWAAQHALPDEAQTYVPKLLAVARLGAAPETYGLRLASPNPWPALTDVTVPPATPLEAVAAAWDVSGELIAAWNPALLRGTTPPDRPYVLRLPADGTAAKRDRLLATLHGGR